MVVQTAPRATSACPTGAVQRPGFNLINVAIDIATAGILDVVGITQLAPWLFDSITIGSIATTALCSSNPPDPGDFNISMLVVPPLISGIPSPDAPAGSLNKWIWDKAYYYAFQQACQCADGTFPGPPSPITPPTHVDPTPTQPGHQDQVTQILNNQTSATNALQQLYNGLQVIGTDARDLRFRYVENLIQRIGATQFSLTGEGQQSLNSFTQTDGSITQDTLGVLVELTSIPTTVARRGVTNQRLYGVGSIEWDCRDPSSPLTHIIAQRDSIHYDIQFILAPQHVQTYTVRWRLQPGVQAFGYQVPRNVDNAIYAPMAPYPGAYQTFNPWNGPSGWQDPPIYPRPAALAVASGGGTPP